MKKLALLIPAFIAAVALLTAQPAKPPAKLKVLILDGQNNHKWRETTPLLREILENAERFSVEVSTSPAEKPKAPKLPKNATPEQKAKAAASFQEPTPAEEAERAAKWAQWRPKFADYDVVVSNYNGEDWPQEVREALVSYVKNGGGFVVYHAADNPFAGWAEYNQMIGLGGWGGRNEKSGPYLRLINGVWTKVNEPGPCGGHDKQAEFIMENFAPEHPIMKGLPAKWLHSKDELYYNLRGPAENLSVLGHATSKDNNTAQPMLMTISFGKGRVFHTTLGHYVEGLSGVGFQATFSRGTEWAATGSVTLTAPAEGVLTTGPTAAVKFLKNQPVTP